MGSEDRSPLRVGIIGAARIAKKQYRAIKMIPEDVIIVAVGSRDPAKAQAMIGEFGLADATATTYEGVLDDPRVQAVYIPLPTTMHVEWVRRAAAAGKHVLLEKPIAVTAADADAIVDACAAAGVQLMDGTMWMHNPRTAAMEAVLKSGALGPVREATSVFSFHAPPDFQAADIRFKAAGDPLGALGDLGWYCVRGILWAFDFEDPVAVQAHAGPTYNAEGVPVAMGATLVFTDGRRGVFTASFDRALSQRLEAAGTVGTLAVEGFVIPSGGENRLEFSVTRDHGFESLDLWDVTQRDVHSVRLDVPQEALMWRAFAGCVRRAAAGGGPDPRWPALAAQTQKVLCAVAESAAVGGATLPFSGGASKV